MAPPPRGPARPQSEVGGGYMPKKKSGGIFGNITGAVKNAARFTNDQRFTAGFVPNDMGQTLGDLFGDRLRGSRGGGGGYDPYAAQRAADERRRAAMRAAIQQQYGGAIGQLGTQNAASSRAMGDQYNQARGRMAPIYAQNKQMTGQYSNQLAQLAQNASRGVLDQGDMLARDLQGQGAGLGDLQGMISGDVRDILGARSAADSYNTRLAQIMGLSQTDNSALLSALLQSGQSTRENTYAQQLAQLRNEQAMKLAELA